MQKAGWKIKGVGGAAELFGVSPTTLFARTQKMSLKRPVLPQENTAPGSMVQESGIFS